MATLVSAVKKFCKDAFYIIRWMFVLWLCLFIPIEGYLWMDRNGYITHDKTVDFFMPHNWLVGENRTCIVDPELDRQGHPTGRINQVSCPEGMEGLESHNMNVSFHGPVGSFDREAKVPTEWTCTRHSDGFSCKVVDK